MFGEQVCSYIGIQLGQILGKYRFEFKTLTNTKFCDSTTKKYVLYTLLYAMNFQFEL